MGFRPVAMITTSAVKLSPSEVRISLGWPSSRTSSTSLTSSMATPRDSTCSRQAVMRSMPWMLLYEGTFSTVWVQFTSPPHTSFSTMRTERLARAAYSAAVMPAMPPPMIRMSLCPFMTPTRKTRAVRAGS